MDRSSRQKSNEATDIQNDTIEKLDLIDIFRTLHQKKKKTGVPAVAQWLTNPTRNHEVAVSVPALGQWVKDLALP